MKVGALAPWYGSKRGMAPEIVAELGPHRAYWEPFCGSMAVLLAKPSATMETVNDLHGQLVNLARVIRDNRLGPALYRRLRRTWCAKELFSESVSRYKAVGQIPAPDAPDIDLAYDFFVSSWLGMNGVAGSQSYNQGFCRRYTAKGGSAETRWANAVASIPAWRRRLGSVTILSECGIALCERIADERGAVLYADPPYLVKGATYVHDFADADHVRLAAALRRFRLTRVVVSYYHHPRLVDLYPGWRKVDCSRTKALVNQGKRDQNGATTAPEVLLVNGPSYLQPASEGLF